MTQPIIAGLDSVVFATRRLADLRDFYSRVLGLTVGTYVKDGRTLPDENDTYVNFTCGGTLLGFEVGDSPETGTIVLKVTDLAAALTTLETHGVASIRRSKAWAILKDPEDREIILQA